MNFRDCVKIFKEVVNLQEYYGATSAVAAVVRFKINVEVLAPRYADWKSEVAQFV